MFYTEVEAMELVNNVSERRRRTTSCFSLVKTNYANNIIPTNLSYCNH